MKNNKLVCFFLGHPAHFHLLKNVANNLIKDGYNVDFLIKRKDVLEELLKNASYKYVVIRKKERKSTSIIKLVSSLVVMDLYVIKYLIKCKPTLFVGTYCPLISHWLRVPFFSVNEDDADVVPRFVRTSYPYATEILTPNVCNCGKWDKKSIKYNSYHELAYLHPNTFIPDKTIASKYVKFDKPFVLIRFAKLSAHHDSNIKGISIDLAKQIIEIIEENYNVYITSEIQLVKDLNRFQLKINPIDIHHVMAFASFFIGDSQTMAAESGVLGVPFIRYNDFVGKIGYLRDLEDSYQLGWGIRTDRSEELIQAVKSLSTFPNRDVIFKQRREKMLKEKIDLSSFLTWFIEHYPESKKTMKEYPDYQNRFK